MATWDDVRGMVRLPEIDVAELEELIVESWLCQAPKRVAKRVPGR